MITYASSRNTSVPVLLALVLATSLSGTAGYSQHKQGVANPVDLIREASVAAKANLRSGSGKAVFERFVKMPGKTDLKLVRKADCTIHFEGDKYYIRLDFKVDKSSEDSVQYVVCDGKVIITNELSPLFRPKGAQGAIFPVEGTNIRGYSADVPFNPTKLREAIIDVDEAIRRFKPDITSNKDTGIIEGTFSQGNIIQRFAASPASGYNPERRLVFNTEISMTEPVTEYVAKWGGGNRFRESIFKDVPVPLPADYVNGLDHQNADFERGSYTSYLDGELSNRGWYHYYIYGLALKWPLGGLLLVIGGLLLTTVGRCSAGWRDESWLYVPAIAILLLVSLRIGFNHHLRYVLPAVPFFCIGAGKVVRLPQVYGKCSAFLVGVLLAWSVFSGLRYHPHHISYFNELGGGPKNGWRHFIDSNYDWGQDLFELKKWVEKHPEAEPLHLAYFNIVDPSLVGIRHTLPPVHAPNVGAQMPQDLPRDGPQPGWHAVSVNFVCGLPFVAPDGKGGIIQIRREMYTYFQRFEPVDRAGYSIFIYHITPGEANRVRSEMGLPPLPEAGR